LKHRISLIAVAGLTLAAAAPEKSAEAPQQAEPALSSDVAPVSPEIPVVLLVDLSTGQTLFSREPQRRFMPASVTKVMTAYTAFKLIAEGKLSPATPVMVSEQVAEQWSGEGSSLFLKAGDRITIGELLLGVTTVSANDAAVMLSLAATGSEDDWLDLMNANAAELGMRDSHFGSPNGFPDEGRTYTSAHDLAVLAEALTTRYPRALPPLFRASWAQLPQHHPSQPRPDHRHRAGRRRHQDRFYTRGWLYLRRLRQAR
jgi:D-alanyl-D-alanine carboxypeptidase (penicillin-binding protein 5/6)